VPPSSAEKKERGVFSFLHRRWLRFFSLRALSNPAMPSPFTFIDLCAGIGGMRIPFGALGGECVFSSEIDPHCQRVYAANFGESPFGDITSLSPDAVPDHDLLLAGFPCQAFSVIGRQLGFSDTRGTLFFSIAQILQAKRPRAFLLENVKQLRTHDEGRTFLTILRTLEGLGYVVYHTVLNSLDFGVPQKRERTYIVGLLGGGAFSFPSKKTDYDLSSVLEPENGVGSKYFASEHIRVSRRERVGFVPSGPSVWHENKSGNVSALPCPILARCGRMRLIIICWSTGSAGSPKGSCFAYRGSPSTLRPP
jgi:DNA (cytosine-5)-methyltransferase 1